MQAAKNIKKRKSGKVVKSPTKASEERTTEDVVDKSSNLRPKRLAAISAASLNTIYGKELFRKGDSESSENFEEFYRDLNSDLAKATLTKVISPKVIVPKEISRKTISPKTASGCRKSLFGKSSVRLCATNPKPVSRVFKIFFNLSDICG